MNNGAELGQAYPQSESYPPGYVGGGLLGSSDMAAKANKEWEATQTKRKWRDGIIHSIQRVVQCIELYLNNTDGLFKSDLDNAIRHSMEVTKKLRAIKQSLTTTTETKSAETTTQPSQQNLT